MAEPGTVAALRRYPVKSMLGEDLRSVMLTPSGLEGDRVAAVIDRATGQVATAKHPRLWRGLLAFGARWNDGSPRIILPGGGSVAVTDAGQLAVLPVGAAVDLFANGNRELVRLCDGAGCNLWFYDRTKSHRRRWCSMAVCGNRDKVKNHRARSDT